MLAKDLQGQILAAVHFSTEIAAFYEYDVKIEKRTIF